MSAFGDREVEREPNANPSVPSLPDTEFGCRLGCPAVEADRYACARQPLERFAHRNMYESTGRARA